MTNSNGLYCRPTEALIQPAKTKFYPLDIPVPHHQLRHFISTVDNDWIYYANQHDIYTFHVPTQRRLLVVTVPFIPRCLAAGLGWICVGGEINGDCAFVKLDQDEGDTHSQTPPNSSFASPSGRHSSVRPIDMNRGLRPSPDLLVKELGGEIVNSVALHELSNKGVSDWNEPVALVSNNDKSVKIFSLVQRKIITELVHPIPMNYALISPDSEILAAVGDGRRAYFYRRQRTTNKATLSNVFSSTQFPKYDWKLFATPKMPVGERMTDDHSFSITFSPSGHMCAVSSQGGMITVLHMGLLTAMSEDDDSDSAILCSFKSSRPGLWGCVRSMAFSPDPWDLLVWAEDHGRVGIADLRQAFCRRQIIKLETHDIALERIKIHDVTDPNIRSLDIKGRLIYQYRERLHLEQEPPASDPLLGRPEPWSQQALLRRQTRDRQPPSRTELDLDERERSILDTLEVTMEEVYEASLNPNLPYSVNYTSSPRVRASLENEDRGSPRPHADNSDTSDVHRDRHIEGTRTGDRSYLPRRRSSVVLSQSSPSQSASSTLAPRAVSRTRLTASPSRMPREDDEENTSDRDLPPLISTNDLTPTADGSDSQPLPYNIPPSDPWHVIQTALESARAADASSSRVDPSMNLSRLEAALAGERRLSLTSPSSQPSTSTSTSAQTSTLPTTSIPHTDRHRLNLQRQELLRRSIEQETARLVGRMTAGVAGSRESPARVVSTESEDRSQEMLASRMQSRYRAAAVATSAANARTSRGGSERRTTELSGRVSDSDMRLARQMMMSSVRSMMDRNGNWMAGEALERLMNRAGADADGLGGVTTSEIARERGVGTAGVGWSPDGRSLFVGTEEGIFQYAVNLADRKTFPAFALR